MNTRRACRAALSLLLLASIFVIPGPGPVPALAEAPLSLLEPYRGVYFGVNLNWGADNAASFNDRLGRSAAVYVQFSKFPIDGEHLRYVDEFMDQVRAVGGIALLTLEPWQGLDIVTPEDAAALAGRLRSYNERGVPVLVRFAHEMNGSWYPWSQQPAEYTRTFRLLAAQVHSVAPRTAMLWAPNYGGGYPFRGGAYTAEPGSPAFSILDTNQDGQLALADDPYAPYYPGDDAVDWVGMTLYHWGAQYPWGNNVLPEPGKFAAQLTGSYIGTAGDDRNLPNFYRLFAEQRGKPMAIPETSALYNTAESGAPELEIKRAWWSQVFGALPQFPRIKMVNWFEWRKPESELKGAVVDWTVTSSPDMAAAFLVSLPPDLFLFADDLPRAVSLPVQAP